MTDYIKREYDEWCTDCKEYDKERHCCPRWNKVIRDTVDEIRQNADVRENVRAVWIERELQGLMGRRHTETRCGNCGYEVYRKTPFCPNCGAQMTRGEA